MKNVIFALFLSVIFASCGGNSKQSSNTVDVELQIRKRIITSDSIAAGVKYVSEKIIDKNNPPKVLDYSLSRQGSIGLDISQYASSVEYVRFRHPAADSSGRFFRNFGIHYSYERGASSGNFSSMVILMDEGYIIGDILSGLYHYDLSGNIIDTIVVNNFPYKFDKGYFNDTVIHVKYADIHGFISGGQNIGSEVIYNFRDTSSKTTTYWYDLNHKMITMERHYKDGENVFYPNVLNDSITYDLSAAFLRDDAVFLRVFDKIGDTLALFKDITHERLRPKGNTNSPESPVVYNFGGKLHIRASYNDTVYVMEAPNRLVAKYVINLGERRVDPQTGMMGNKSEKLLPQRWMETDDFILFTYSQNIDVPNTRNNNQVQYYYTIFDKKSGKIHTIDSGGRYPDEFIVSNPINGGVPFYFSGLYYSDRKGAYHVVYDKRGLKQLLNDKNVNNLPQIQRAKLKEMHDSIEDGELLMMLMK